MTEIIFDVYVKDEFLVEHRVTDKLEAFMQNKRQDKLFTVCEFTLSNFVLPKSIARDGQIRIRIETTNDTIPETSLFLVDAVEVVDKNSLKIIGKSEPALLFEPYQPKTKEVIDGDTYNAIISTVLDRFSLTYEIRVEDIENTLGFYLIDDESIGMALTSLLDALGLDYYYKNSTIIVEKARGIATGDSAVGVFTQSNITSIKADNTDATGLGMITFNAKESEIESIPSMVLVLSHSPQPLSPSEVLVWVDQTTGDEFKISPQPCNVRLFYNPLNKTPDIAGFENVSYESDYTVVESYTLTDEATLGLSGGIKEINGIEYVPYNVVDESSKAVGLYSNDSPSQLLFQASLPLDDLKAGNNIKIVVQESGLNQIISSSMTGTGTENDPYTYTISLGNQENIAAATSTASLDVISLVTFSEYVETLLLQASAQSAALNNHLIKIDGTGATQTSGYSYTTGQTIFYFDSSITYDSIAQEIYDLIRNAVDLPYTIAATQLFDTTYTQVVKNEVYTIGTFANGLDSSYKGQRDLKAISNFVSSDPNAAGILQTVPSLDETNPSTPIKTFFLVGGVGLLSNVTELSNMSFEPGHNKIIFGQTLNGTVRVNYKTDIIRAKFPPTAKRSFKTLTATHYNAIIKHNHAITGIEYFPEQYYASIDVSDFLDIDYIDAIYKNVEVVKVDYVTGVEVFTSNTITTSTGEIEILLTAYAQYGFKIAGLDTIYLRHYANLHETTLDKIIMREVI